MEVLLPRFITSQYFDAQIVPDLASEKPFSKLFAFLTYPLHSLSISLLSLTQDISRFIFFFSSLSSGLSHFCKEPWFFLLESGVQKPGFVPISMCSLVLGQYCFQPLSQQAEVGNVYMYACIHRRSLKHICFYFCICLSIY